MAKLCVGEGGGPTNIRNGTNGALTYGVLT